MVRIIANDRFQLSALAMNVRYSNSITSALGTDATVAVQDSWP
jgi:hypothetical protein